MRVHTRPEQDTDEFLQHQLERHINEQCELHGWAIALTIANPVDILILLETLDADDEPILGDRHD